VEPTEPSGSASGESTSDDLNGVAAPTARSARRSLSIGGVVAALGGAVVVVGSLLEMVKIGFGADQLASTTTTYLDTDNGKVVAALGAVALVLAVATLVRSRAGIIPGILVAACGLAAFGLAVSDRFDLDNVGNDYRHKFFNDSQARGLVQVTIGPALYVVIAGGLIVAIGAVLASRET
jgi:hypothetical protein